MIAYSIGAGFDLNEPQLHVVALTSLAGSAVAMMLSPARSLTNRDLFAAGGIALGYTLILALPETRHPLELMAPHVTGILLSAIGAVIAMSSFTRRHPLARRRRDRARARDLTPVRGGSPDADARRGQGASG